MRGNLISIVLFTLLVCVVTWTIAGQSGGKGTEKEAAATQGIEQNMDADSFLQKFTEAIKARGQTKMEELVKQAGADIVYKVVISQAKNGISSVAEAPFVMVGEGE
jgi:hypothetical protein